MSNPGNLHDLKIVGSGKLIMQHKCIGNDQGEIAALTLSLYDGMIILDDAAGTSSFPARNFSLSHTLKINGVCLVDYSGSYKIMLQIGIVLLTAAVVCGIAALSPPFAAKRESNKKLILTGSLCAAGVGVAYLICLINIINGYNFYPYNSFLFRELVPGDDLFQTVLPVRYTFLPYSWLAAGNYFPFTMLAKFLKRCIVNQRQPVLIYGF